MPKPKVLGRMNVLVSICMWVTKAGGLVPWETQVVITNCYILFMFATVCQIATSPSSFDNVTPKQVDYPLYTVCKIHNLIIHCI